MNFNKQMAVPVSPKIEYNFFIHWINYSSKVKKRYHSELQ